MDGDESGAFNMLVRVDVESFTRRWESQCSFERWARRFYGRQRVLLWTAKGLMAPVRIACGFSQGYTLAATTYGTLGVLRTRCLCNDAGWRVGLGLWLHKSVYCDDRRWCGRSREEVIRVAETTHALAQDACASSNQA